MKRLAIFALCLFMGAGVCVAQDTMGSDAALLFQYYRFNAMYFFGELPVENITIIWDKVISKSEMAGTWITHYEGEPEKIKIGISLYAQDCETCVSMAILHQMVHIKLRDWNLKTNDMHGDTFQKEMLKLAQQGAFALYW